MGFDFFVLLGIEIDGCMVFISDEVINLEWLFCWIVIIGSGYIGFEFVDVYIVFGCEVMMIEVMDKVMFIFDFDIVKIVGCYLIDGCDIDVCFGLLVCKVILGCFVQIELVDFNSCELVEIFEVDVVLVVIG